MLRMLLALMLGLLLVPSSQTARADSLQPAVHADFPRYTFALTWQPGFCSTGGGCLADQPTGTLIGLHGLWASLPVSLAGQGVKVQQWWSKGCDLYVHSDAAPVLPAAISQQLNQVMPHLQNDLLIHEYDKHVQCFQFDPVAFFRTALTMRSTVVDSDFGRYLILQAGQAHTRDDLVQVFIRTFGTDQAQSLQLQCANNHQQQNVLTQIWFTLAADQLANFPQPSSWVNTPDAEYEDNCRQSFLLPAW